MRLMIATAEEVKLKCQVPELHFISNMLGCQLGRSNGKCVNTRTKTLNLVELSRIRGGGRKTERGKGRLN